MAQNEALIRLALYESKDIVPVQTLAPDTYTFPLQPEGNSLLSSLFLKSADPGATVKVNFWDFGPGDGDQPGERVDLQSHQLFTDADFPATDRIIVTAMHNKPRVEVIVTGGSVEVGVYVTVVATFASDLDANLKKQAELADLVKDKGLVTMGYDATLGRFYFIPLENGAVKVGGTVTTEVEGSPFHLRTDDLQQTTPASTVSLFTAPVPLGKQWRIVRLDGQCRAYGYFELFVDSVRIAKSLTGPASENSPYPLDPYEPATAGQVVELRYTQSFGPAMDVSATASLLEVDA